MVTHEDNLKFFLPKTEVKFVILGTMVAINARTIDGFGPEDDVFYYNNNRNHFWRVLQYLLEPKKEAKKNLTIKEKKEFLEKHGIAICNLVQKIEVPNKFKHDPSDTVLFDAFKKRKIEFKSIPMRLKKVLLEKPLFFTCRRKKGIENLLDGFLQKNSLDSQLKDRVWYWPTPTRCNPQARALLWKEEMENFQTK
jgi:hypothetical protein